MLTNYKYSDITSKILKSFYNVYNELGYGFLEKVYEKSMLIELQKQGLFCEKQKAIKVYYKKELVGDYYADIIVENKIIIELKAVEKIIKKHEVQLVNYLKATEIEVGLLLNFGSKPEHIRRVLTAEYRN
jgi:GxxExxY protein